MIVRAAPLRKKRDEASRDPGQGKRKRRWSLGKRELEFGKERVWKDSSSFLSDGHDGLLERRKNLDLRRIEVRKSLAAFPNRPQVKVRCCAPVQFLGQR